MAGLALILLVAWLAIVAGARGYIQLRRTGDPGIQFRDRRGSPQWWSRIISSAGVVLAFAAPVAEFAGLAPIAGLDRPALGVGGVTLMALGVAGTVAAQVAMGASWRGDVNPDVRTQLVTTGPFRLVRNPILSCTGLTAVGFVLLVPNGVALLMLAAFLVAMQIQVRLVEEPYLARVHGETYRRYAARTGRFVPGSAVSGMATGRTSSQHLETSTGRMRATLRPPAWWPDRDGRQPDPSTRCKPRRPP